MLIPTILGKMVRIL